ncbi:MAG: hypothetical protein JWM80_3869 [Cyanobacteria bacterium RYN_339]|nr:hypothetical protein [Cyanobacteria bacterium RYN_339]
MQGVNSRILDWLNAFEQAVPVDTWVHEDIRVWPIIRFKAAFGLFYRMVAEDAHVPGLVDTAARSAWLKRLASLPLRQARASWLDRIHAARGDGPYDVVFFNEEGRYSAVEDRCYDNYCDPLVRSLAERGFRSLRLDGSDRYCLPRYSPSRFVRAQLDVLAVAARFKRRTTFAPVAELEGFLEALGAPVTGLDLDPGPVLPLLRAQADYFKRVLRRSGARLGVVVCYYNLYGMAFDLACRELGIPSMDIQHGLQGAYHAAYGRWGRVPADGYELLPSLFWCWSTDEAAVIAEWAEAARGRHAALPGGNLLLSSWQDLDRPAREREREALVARAGDVRPWMLVTLSGLEPPAVLDELVAAIRSAGSQAFWWVRCHPGRPEQAEGIQARLAVDGVACADALLATRTPLYTLLGEVDGHLTGFSSTVIEAAALGVPSVMWQADGPELFPAQVLNGLATYAPGPSQAVAALRAWLAAPTGGTGRLDADLAAALDAVSAAIRGGV